MPPSSNYAHCRYFSVDSRARRWGSYVTTLGESRISPGSSYPPIEHPPRYHFDWEQGRELNECQVVYISNGCGIIETERASFDIRAGDALLLRPGVWHRYKPAADTGWHEHWVGMGGSTVEQIITADLFGSKSPVIAVREERALLDAFHQLFKTADEGGSALQPELAARAMVLLSLLYASTRPATSGAAGDNKIIERARTLMLADSTQNMSLEGMAKQLNLSYSKFRRLFRESTGISLHQYRIHLRISSARELLRTTDLRIKEIGYRCGFDEEHYFCRLFKIHTGTSPGEFRAQCIAPSKPGQHRAE